MGSGCTRFCTEKPSNVSVTRLLRMMKSVTYALSRLHRRSNPTLTAIYNWLQLFLLSSGQRRLISIAFPLLLFTCFQVFAVLWVVGEPRRPLGETKPLARFRLVKDFTGGIPTHLSPSRRNHSRNGPDDDWHRRTPKSFQRGFVHALSLASLAMWVRAL
jgi:hypothetical protein